MDGKPVDLDIIRREQKIGAAIDHPGSNCIAEFRVDLDRGLGGLDFILARVDQVGRIEDGTDTEPLPALHLECCNIFLRHAARQQDFPDLTCGHDQGLGTLGLLMLPDLAGKLVVDRLGDLDAATCPQRILQDRFKDLSLFCSGHRRFHMEDRIDKLLVDLAGLSGVKESVVDICCPVIKGREQKAKLRRSDSLSGSTVKFIVPREISQLYLALLDGAHHTDDVGEHLIRGIRLQGIILAPMGDIVAVTGQEQQVTAVPHVQTVNYLVVKGLAGLVVLKLGIPQCGEQAVFLTVCYLLSGEYDINEVFPQGAGKGRSLPLKTIEGIDTRPTTDRIKETLFNMLQYEIADCRFLDLFAGSGQIGLEAVSRGAKEAVFVESGKKAAACIQDNINFTRFNDQCRLLQMDVMAAIRSLEGKGAFQIIFMDPPYNQELEKDVLMLLSKSSLVDESTVIIVEASLKTGFEYLDELGFTLDKCKKYKTNLHAFISRKE